MGRECGTYGGDEKCIQSFSWETSRKEVNWTTYK
jgi:hypothetical protein